MLRAIEVNPKSLIAKMRRIWSSDSGDEDFMTLLQESLTPERLDKITASLHDRLKPSRVLHIIGSAHLAVLLAEAHDVDMNAALLAGLLHDVAKFESREEQRELIIQHEGGIEPELQDYSNLWHAVAGSILARVEHGVECPAILRAIRIHPTGEAEMNDLEKIVFLSDYVEPQRKWDGAGVLRMLALENLDLATDIAIKIKCEHVRAKGLKLQAAAGRALKTVHKRHGKKWNPRKAYKIK